MEDHLNGNHLNGRQPEWKMIFTEEKFNGRQPQWKTTTMEDNLNGRWRTSIEPDLNGR